MTITLDEATETLLQRQLAAGRFENANELLTHALALVEAETAEPASDWLYQNREMINLLLDESSAEEERGEGYTPEEAQALLASI